VGEGVQPVRVRVSLAAFQLTVMLVPEIVPLICLPAP
jgi:hypothetical protein